MGDVLNNIEEVKELEESFTKAIINAKIITNRMRDGSKSSSMLAKLAIMGKMQRGDGEQNKDKAILSALVIR